MTDTALFTVNNIWVLVAASLVFIMHLGFSTLEAGLVRSKNVVNILFKNVMILSIGLVSYYLIGFSLMYPNQSWYGVIGFSQVGLSLPVGASIDYAAGHYTYWTDFIFQAMFAATCCTIVSGAVAERMKLNSFLIISIFFISIGYPLTGMWKWGGGWLDQLGFYDFAGSTLVHSVGGWGALAVVLLLGPRIGKYGRDGINPIPGHNIPLAAVGVLLLWFGWFGFNGGSVLSADPDAVSLVFVNTALAGAAGAIGCYFCSFYLFKSHDLSMVLNGILGGLVGITAGADVMTPFLAVLIGMISGVLIPFSVVFFDRLKIDDPVGAISVHLVCGIWGTLAVGIVGVKAGWEQLALQGIGVVIVGLFTFLFIYLITFLVKKTIGIRVTEEHELEGMDLVEHGSAPSIEGMTSTMEVRVQT
ncbi:ammonium transporter [Membranicola marinus]|uniref:Ammonium transporter n=1 Tax=Membranihabitans marinus TaxID=1227546 RepID=A0A953HXK1_9BACT|nr:ammonium transporter [Membranihabitans marinus]MBY5957572.1 ammonium transporter [Membranihabitans marinus]